MAEPLKRLALSAVGVAALFGFFLGVATHFDFDPWRTTSCGQVFDAQLRALLDGRMNIDPDVLGIEAFVRDGLSYTYFGILPALLRLPLLGIPDHDWTTLSCALAATLASLCLLQAWRSAFVAVRHDCAWRLIALTLAVTFVLSGPQFELTAKPSIYVEAILWAFVFATAFLWLAMPLASGSGDAAPGRLSALAVMAGLALLTRVTFGLSLYVAWGLLVIALVLAAPAGARRGMLRRCVPGCVILALGAVTVGSVNHARWGTALEFADLSRNVYYAASPDKMERLATFGTFEAARVPYALSYYFTPTRFREQRSPAQDRRDIQRLFDNVEGPPNNQLLSKLLWWTLALVALGLAARRPDLSPSRNWAPGAIALGLLTGPLFILCYGYLAFRFGAEFVPAALFGSLRAMGGLPALPADRRRALFSVLLVLLVAGAAGVQITTSWQSAARYFASDYTDGACR